jgi:hypothetical protein
MKYAITLNNAYFDYGESNFIPKGKVVEVLDYLDTKTLVMFDGFKRYVKNTDIKQAYVLLTFPKHEKIKTTYITNIEEALNTNYYDIPKIFDDYNEECLKDYIKQCLKVIKDDMARALTEFEQLNKVEYYLNSKLN